jgi:hypothetical protein
MKNIDLSNFNDYDIKVISVENNEPEAQNFIYFDKVGEDEIFYNSKFFKF